MINADRSRLYAHAREFSARVVGFGIRRHCDVHGSNVQQRPGALAFTVNGQYTFSLPLIGEHNVYNALAVIAIANQLGVSWETIRQRLLEVRAAPLRMEPRSVAGTDCIMDCYNANPGSARAAVAAFSQLSTTKKKIFVFGIIYVKFFA